jgi:hypothetical protein
VSAKRKPIPMTFVFPFILGGLVLIGVPVLIHLIMRQKPKTLPFPAFRFLIKRHRKNLRKMRLRHLVLLTLRILLIAAICLAVARPKIFNEGLKIGNDRPVAAILLFDTSYSMEYKVADLTRLEDAKKRGRELLGELPEGSRVAVLDTADLVQTGKGEWLTSIHQARERIERLKPRYGNAPVTSRLEHAYRLFADLARGRDDDTSRQLTRLLCVFSDGTRGGWDADRLGKLHDLRDQIAPPFERLPQVRDGIPGLIELLGELRQRLPPSAGQDYPEQSVIDLLGQLRERIGLVRDDDYPDADFNTLLPRVRSRSRELLGKVRARDKVPDDAKEYRDKLVTALQSFERNLRGVHEIFVDVGVDNPVDLAVADLELPRQLRNELPRQMFAANEKIVLRAVLEASGDDFDTELHWRIGKKTEKQVVKINAGQSATSRYALDAKELGPGTHQLRVELATPDALTFNNNRAVTLAVRAPREVLVIADDLALAKNWKDALDEVRAFQAVLVTPKQAIDKRPDQYHAICLFSVTKPDRDLWNYLKDYVQKGGGLTIIPPAQNADAADLRPAYNAKEAQDIMPARLAAIAQPGDSGAGHWNFETMTFQHAMLEPFRDWKDQNVDIIKEPATAFRFWQVEPHKEKVVTLVTYTDKNNSAALLERHVERPGGGRSGRVLLFTTPFDQWRRAKAKDEVEARWNNYLEKIHASFYLAIAHLSTAYLAGDAEPVKLNFITGQDVPIVTLPLAPRFPTYVLRRDGAVLETLTVEPAQNELRLPQAVAPGNYTVEGDEEKRVASFSVNMPREECVLQRVSTAEIEALFGSGAVVPVDFQTNLRDALHGHWSQPLELLPLLLVALLLMLALENLLANKFYRREPEA